MKKLLFPLFVTLGLITLFFITGCMNCIDGQGQIVTHSRDIEEFEKIELNINADVVIGVASKTVMQIHAQPNVMKAITTKVRGGKLIIDASPCIKSSEPIQIKVFTSKLNGIEVNGSGMIKTANPVTVGEIEFEVSGSGKIFADVYANEVKVDVSGSGQIVVNGTTNNQEIKISGSGEYKGLGLRSFKAKVDLTGSGKALLSVLNELKTDISGSGEIIYAGNPKVESDISGSGKITKME